MQRLNKKALSLIILIMANITVSYIDMNVLVQDLLNTHGNDNFLTRRGYTMPAHIFIQGHKYSNTRNIVQWIASRTGWPIVLDGDLIEQAGNKFGVQAKQIRDAVYMKKSIINRITNRQNRAKAFLTKTLSDALRSEASIFSGMLGNLIPPKMPQVLRVLVTADTNSRIHRALDDRKIPEKVARRMIDRNDHQLFQDHRHLSLGVSTETESYDVVVPSDVINTEDAALMILEKLAEKTGVASDIVESALDDFSLAADVQLRLAEKGFDVRATAKNKQIVLTIDRNRLRLCSMSEKLKKVVAQMSDVNGVEITFGRHFYQTDIYRRCRFEVSEEVQFRNYKKRYRSLRLAATKHLSSNHNEEAKINPIQLGQQLRMQ